MFNINNKKKSSLLKINNIPFLLKNQNRLPVENKIQERVIIPTINNIDFYNNLNNTTKNKTIINVFADNLNGFGDFLRGSILLAQYCKYFDINFKMDISRHKLSNCLNIKEPILSETTKIHLICFNSNNNQDTTLYSLINNFINSNEESIYITTNLYYNSKFVTEDIKYYINNFFNFKQNYYDSASNLFNLKKYNVLHIRCLDNYFNANFEDNYLLSEIIKLQLDKNTIVISNCYALKQQLNKLFGFYFIDIETYHTGKLNNYTELECTIIEYIILSRSSYTHCFSYYHHGSGFSEQCSILNNIPYKVVYLPDINIHNSNNLLVTYYNNLLEGHNTIDNTLTSYENINYNNISFITLTNTGYVDYTLNCIKSLNNINIKQPITVYCIGEEGYNKLKNNNIVCELIIDNSANNFQIFRKNSWSNVVYYKFEIIYNNLLKNEYVCITDGDIVYENNTIFNYLIDNIKDNDILIQSEGIYHNDLCSGFMFIKSNKNTLSLFNPTNIEMYKNKEGWDDQIYINSIKYKLKFKKLPLNLFPTGQYYYEYYKTINPYLIHFNWIIGNEKINKMIIHNKWYMSNKIKICQYGIDGFGHQLEGTLRLISLSLNNKADYQYNYNKEYIFEHNNFKKDNLINYFKESLKIISNKINKKYINNHDISFNIILNEQRTFNEIKQNDITYENNIYCYDGVSSKILNNLPLNFEELNDFEKNLHILREAFVEKNIYLPPKSYNNSKINVCCHIRLGDAVGQRILDTNNIIKIIKKFQEFEKYYIIIHSDGDVSSLQSNNTIIHDKNRDVLQILSDFIHSDILIMNYSSLSISAHILGKNTQNVICPTNAGPTFKYRILNKCISIDTLLKNN